MSKFKFAVMKTIRCPRCAEEYEVFLSKDEEFVSGVEICRDSTNPAFAGKYGYVWCGAQIVFELGRSYTYVGVVDMEEQPSRFRRVVDEKPHVGGEPEPTAEET